MTVKSNLSIGMLHTDTLIGCAGNGNSRQARPADPAETKVENFSAILAILQGHSPCMFNVMIYLCEDR